MWTDVKSSFTTAVSAVVVDRPTRLKALYLHSAASGTAFFYDASAATSTTGPLLLQLELPHRASPGNPDTTSLLIPGAGIRFTQAMFVKVSGGAGCGITYFYD